MLINIIITFLIFNAAQNQDSVEPYKTAYTYIVNSKYFTEFTQDSVEDICLSNRIFNFDEGLFLNEELEYENLDSISKMVIRDSLKNYKYERTILRFEDFSEFNDRKENCHLKLYFSEIKGNKLIAKLIKSNTNLYVDDYKNSIKSSNEGLDFLFYFNDENNIEKVFVQEYFK